MSRWEPGRRDHRITTNPRYGVKPRNPKRQAARFRRHLPRFDFAGFLRGSGWR